MYLTTFCILCVVALLQIVLGLSNKPCSKEDSTCFKNLAIDIFNKAVKGNPALKMEQLDPMKHEYISGKFSIINYQTYNTTVVGAKDCYIIHAKLDLDQNSMVLNLICPIMYMYGAYDVSGKLLIVPIEGSGDYRIDAKDYHIYVDAVTKIISAKDGKEYLNFKSFKVNADLEGGMVVDLKNLFNGQHKELAKAALKVANEEWKAISKELQGPILDANVKKIVQNMNKYLKSVPLQELFIY